MSYFFKLDQRSCNAPGWWTSVAPGYRWWTSIVKIHVSNF